MELQLIEQLEYPLPKIKCSIDKLIIESPGQFESYFYIENIGNGLLEGSIFANSSFIKFEPLTFSGNKVKINYVLEMKRYKISDIIRAEAVIISNGGEVVLPIIIKIVAHGVYTKNGVKISSLKDFLNYSKKYPLEAKEFFSSNEFYFWLVSTGYEFMDIFDTIARDSNKERAMENFLILNKLKKKPSLLVSKTEIEHVIEYSNREILNFSLPIKKTGKGYIYERVYTQDESNWLAISKDNINSSDFEIIPAANANGINDDETSGYELTKLNYFINTALISKSVSNKILIGDSISINISVRRKSALIAKASKEMFSFEDSGTINIINNCNKDIVIETYSDDSFIKLEGKRYFIGETAKIPFNIKFSALQLAQLALKKQPIVNTEIYIKANVDYGIIKKTINLTIGEFEI